MFSDPDFPSQGLDFVQWACLSCTFNCHWSSLLSIKSWVSTSAFRVLSLTQIWASLRLSGLHAVSSCLLTFQGLSLSSPLLCNLTPLCMVHPHFPNTWINILARAYFFTAHSLRVTTCESLSSRPPLCLEAICVPCTTRYGVLDAAGWWAIPSSNPILTPAFSVPLLLVPLCQLGLLKAEAKSESHMQDISWGKMPVEGNWGIQGWAAHPQRLLPLYHHLA